MLKANFFFILKKTRGAVALRYFPSIGREEAFGLSCTIRIPVQRTYPSILNGRVNPKQNSSD